MKNLKRVLAAALIACTVVAGSYVPTSVKAESVEVNGADDLRNAPEISANTAIDTTLTYSATNKSGSQYYKFVTSENSYATYTFRLERLEGNYSGMILIVLDASGKRQFSLSIQGNQAVNSKTVTLPANTTYYIRVAGSNYLNNYAAYPVSFSVIDDSKKTTDDNNGGSHSTIEAGGTQQVSGAENFRNAPQIPSGTTIDTTLTYSATNKSGSQYYKFVTSENSYATYTFRLERLEGNYSGMSLIVMDTDGKRQFSLSIQRNQAVNSKTVTLPANTAYYIRVLGSNYLNNYTAYPVSFSVTENDSETGNGSNDNKDELNFSNAKDIKFSEDYKITLTSKNTVSDFYKFKTYNKDNYSYRIFLLDDTKYDVQDDDNYNVILTIYDEKGSVVKTINIGDDMGNETPEDFKPNSTYYLNVKLPDNYKINANDKVETTLTIFDLLQTPKAPSISLYNAGKGSVKVVWTGTDYANYYMVNYRLKGTKSWKKKKVTKNTYVTIKKLKSNRKYQFKVQGVAVDDGYDFAGDWSKTKSIKTR